uniref:Uncharacterized protein n=2 Tax=Eptatretus burgeri TaxID=7764 RepID=A0A8C4QW97_EPTBU
MDCAQQRCAQRTLAACLLCWRWTWISRQSALTKKFDVTAMARRSPTRRALRAWSCYTQLCRKQRKAACQAIFHHRQHNLKKCVMALRRAVLHKRDKTMNYLLATRHWHKMLLRSTWCLWQEGLHHRKGVHQSALPASRSCWTAHLHNSFHQWREWMVWRHLRKANKMKASTHHSAGLLRRFWGNWQLFVHQVICWRDLAGQAGGIPQDISTCPCLLFMAGQVAGHKRAQSLEPDGHSPCGAPMPKDVLLHVVQERMDPAVLPRLRPCGCPSKAHKGSSIWRLSRRITEGLAQVSDPDIWIDCKGARLPPV